MVGYYEFRNVHRRRRSGRLTDGRVVQGGRPAAVAGGLPVRRAGCGAVGRGIRVAEVGPAEDARRQRQPPNVGGH